MDALSGQESVPSVEQVDERATSMARLVDTLMRGRARSSSRDQAAAALADIRAFVRAWRPTSSGIPAVGGASPENRDERRSKPSTDALLKLAQRGVQLHNNARKLPHIRDSRESSGGKGGSVHHDWKSATVAYLRATAASLVSLGSTTSPKDCANLCRLFAKAGELLVDEAGDDVRALDMFDDAQAFFGRLPESYYGAGGHTSNMPSLSAEDLIMAIHKGLSRRIEALSRITDNVEQMLEAYELQLKISTTWSPAGLSVSTAVHAATVGEERFKKGDCQGASRLLRMALKALDVERVGAVGAAVASADAPSARAPGLRRTILFSLAHCYSKSGDHDQAIKCIKDLEGEDRQYSTGSAHDPSFLFAKCKVLTDAGDRAAAYAAAKQLVAATPSDFSSGFTSTCAGSDLDLVSAQMICSREDCSERSLTLFASIASRSGRNIVSLQFSEPETSGPCSSAQDPSTLASKKPLLLCHLDHGTPKAIDARVALLRGLVTAMRLRWEGCGGGPNFGDEPARTVNGVQPRETTDRSGARATEMSEDQVAMDRAEKTADVLVDETKKCSLLTKTQVKAAIEVLVTFAEVFQGLGRWDACARWCERAIALAPGLPNQPLLCSDSPRAETAGVGGCGKGAEVEMSALVLASLLTLRGEMECRMGNFVSSSHTLDKALAACPAYGRAREVAFWSAALDPTRDESSLSARLSTISGSQSGLAPDERPQLLAKCVGLVANRVNPQGMVSSEQDGVATAFATDRTDSAEHDWLHTRVIMVQEFLLDELLSARATKANQAVSPEDRLSSSSPMPQLSTRESGASAPVSMDVDDANQCNESIVAERGVTDGLGPTAGKNDVPTAIQVLAHMVDNVLQFTTEERARGSIDANPYDPSSILSRVLISIDKALSSAASLGIVPHDDPDLEYLSKGCWNLAVRCCGSTCDFPWAEGVGSFANKNQSDLAAMTDPLPGIRLQETLALAPALFKASRNWTELRSDGNVAEAQLTRLHCMILSISATLELFDLKQDSQVDGGAALDSKALGCSGRRDLLEQARKEVEGANGLLLQLSLIKPDLAAEVRSILLVAEMSVLGRLGDAVAVRSLVSSREPDFRRCSTSLLRYCVQLAEDVIPDAKSVSGLCRLCIESYLKDDPVDARAVGSLFRQLLVSASNRDEALLVVDQFTARARDLQEGPAMPSEDVDYFSAKCYNLGLQQMEMGRPGEAERFVGKALGLVKLGSSQAFASRWEETIYQVYITTLQAKGSKVGSSSGSSIAHGGGTSTTSTGEPFGSGRTFLSTGLFPMPSRVDGES